MNLVATITVSGDPQRLRDYRGEVNRLLDEDGSGPFRELHTAGRLEYEFKLHGGIPFPPFVSASQSFPELTVEVRWSESALGRSGRAVIRNGALEEQAAEGRASGGAVLLHVLAGADGSIELALACARWRDVWHGYVIAADQHAFFRIAGSAARRELFTSDGVEGEWSERWSVASEEAAYTEVVPREPVAADELRELDGLAQEFAREWIWFDESPAAETAVERQRFAAYGRPVRSANLRSEKLHGVLRPEGSGLAFGSLRADALWIPEMLRRCWLRAR